MSVAILVTRPRGSANPLVDALERHGYRVYEVPTVEIESAPAARQPLDGFDWIVLTSPVGAQELGAIPPGSRFAVVGEATAAALRKRGVEPAYVAVQTDGLSLGHEIPDVQGRRVALFRASAADFRLPEALRSRGAVVEEITGYVTVVGPAQSAIPLREALADPELAAVTFASGSAVEGFLALGGTTALPAITIGPRTSEVARQHGFEVVAESSVQTAEAFAATIARAIPAEARHHA